MAGGSTPRRKEESRTGQVVAVRDRGKRVRRARSGSDVICVGVCFTQGSGQPRPLLIATGGCSHASRFALTAKQDQVPDELPGTCPVLQT